jgi:hypothetical protein
MSFLVLILRFEMRGQYGPFALQNQWAGPLQGGPIRANAGPACHKCPNPLNYVKMTRQRRGNAFATAITHKKPFRFKWLTISASVFLENCSWAGMNRQSVYDKEPGTMTTAPLYNILFKFSDKDPRSAEYKAEQTQITRAILSDMYQVLCDRKLKYQFHFASRRISDTTCGEQAYMTPAALEAIKTVANIEKIYPMKISAYPLSLNL